MSPWLFNVFLDTVVKRVNERAGRRGAKLRAKSEKRWEIKQILYADDTILFMEPRVGMNQSAFGEGYEWMEFK